MARMSIDDKFLRDPRVIRLAEALGWSRYEARGRLLDVFAVCYDLETDILTPEDVNASADEARLADVMLAVGLADPDDGGIRVHGAASRIEYLVKKVEAGRKGGRNSGESRRNKREAKRSSASPKPEAVGNPPDPVPDVVPVPVPDQIPDLTHRARAIPPPVPQQALRPAPAPPSGDYDHTDPRARGRLAEQAYERIGAARAELAAHLGVPAPLPLPTWSPATGGVAITDVLARIREEGAGAPAAVEHVITAVVAQARTSRDLEFVGTKAFTAGGWRHAREWIPGAKPRAGHARSAARTEQPTIRPKNTDDDAPPIPSWSKP